MFSWFYCYLELHWRDVWGTMFYQTRCDGKIFNRDTDNNKKLVEVLASLYSNWKQTYGCMTVAHW